MKHEIPSILLHCVANPCCHRIIYLLITAKIRKNKNPKTKRNGFSHDTVIDGEYHSGILGSKILEKKAFSSIQIH